MKYFRLSSLEFLYWSANAVYTSFLVVWLRSLGMSNSVIGTIVAVNSVVVLFAQPFWGMVSDRIRSVKKVYIACMAMAAVFMLIIPVFHVPLLICLFLAFLTLFESPLMPLLDTWVIQTIRNEGSMSYGTVRLWGSIGFAASAFLMGKLVQASSIASMFPGYIAIAILVILDSAINHDTGKPANGKVLSHNIGPLLGNARYLIFLAAAALICIPHRAATIFMPALMESVGGTKAQLGIAMSVSALSEIPVFLASKFIMKRMKPVTLILISMVFFALRQLLYAIAATPAQVMLVQLMQGLSFGMFLTGAVYYVDILAPQEWKASAQTLTASVYFGASAILGSMGGGWLIDHFGLKALYVTGTVLDTGVVLLFALSGAILKKDRAARRF